MRKITLRIIPILLLCIMAFPLFADSLYLADTAIFYGEELFSQRISESERDEPLGLVLSGGSARAFAHIGVLQYLEEQHIIPDFIVSNSMGSIVGLLYSAGLSPDQIYELVSDTEFSDLFSLTLPLGGGLLDVSKFTDLVYTYLGERRVEELEIPIIVVCEDLISKRPIRISEGDFYTVLEASFALPVYFDPISYKDHVLLDGGITNLLHLDTAYAYTDDVIVSSTFYENPDLNISNPITILNVSIDIGKRRAGVADLILYDPILIRCAVEDFSFMDFGRLDEIYEAGYESAKEKKTDLEGFSLEQEAMAFEQLREQFELRQSIVKRNLDYFNFIPGKRGKGKFHLQPKGFGAPHDNTPLYDDTVLSLGYWYGGAQFEGSLSLGTSLYTHTTMNFAPIILFDHTQYLSPAIRAKLNGRLLFNSDFTLDEEILTIGLDSILYKRGGVTIDLNATGMIRTVDSFITDYSRLGTGLSVAYNPIGMIGGSYFLEDLTVHGISGEIFSTLKILPTFNMKLSTKGVMSLDPSEQIRFFPHDSYRMNKAEDTSPYFLGASLTIEHEPEDLDFKFAEFLVIDQMTIGLYGDILLTDSTDWAAGITCETNLSLIGIESTSLQLYGGYSSHVEGLAMGYVLGTELY